MSAIGSKRGREIEDEEDRVTKKLKYDQCNISVLPEELLIQILVRVTKKNIDTLSEVSSQWRQITRSRSFWKTSCQLKWVTTVATDSMDFSSKETFVPTVTFGKTLVDWQFYYKLRTKFSKATREVAKCIKEGFGDQVSEVVPRIILMGRELHQDSVKRFLEFMPFLSDNVDQAQFAAFIVPVVDIICDIALLNYNRDEFDWFQPTVMLLTHLVESKKPQAKLFSLCKRTFDLCQMIRDKHPGLISPLVLTMTHLFTAMTSFDERSKKLFTLFTEFVIHLGPLDLGHSDQESQDLIFEYPFSLQDTDGILALRQFQKIDEATIPIEIAIRLYHTSDNWKIKASAVAIGYRHFNVTQEYVEKYCSLAVDAAKQSEQQLAFSGIIGLYRLVERCNETTNMFCFNSEQAAQIFEVFTEALTRYNSVFGIKFYETLLEILPLVQSELISDELLSQFVTNILRMFDQLDENVVHQENHCVYSITGIGTTFKRRLASKLDSVKTALFNLATRGRLKATRLLQCYVDLGSLVLGADFAPEFGNLAKQIVDGTLPFKAKVLKCYGRFADVWIHYTKSDEERDAIVKSLLEAIPKEVFEFGQSKVLILEANQSEKGPSDYPDNLTELLSSRECKDSIPQNKLRLRETTPKHYVPKDQLTPVNPSETVRADPLPGDDIRRLQAIVRAFDGKYVKFAQKVLDASLATFRIVLNRMRMHDIIFNLLVLVRPEMEPSDFLKYIDIVFYAIGRDVDYNLEEFHTDQTAMLNLFNYCFGSVISVGVAKASTIKHAINAYLTMYDFAPKKVLRINDFICYCVKTWPRNTYEGIRQSKLPYWLMKRIKEATSLDQAAPFLKTFATVAAFYGINFTWMEMCVDDPDADEYESSKQYLIRIMPHCRALYEAGANGTIAMAAWELKYLRNFLILYAIYLVHNHSGEVSMLSILSCYDIEVLSKVIASEKSFDTGVPELNELFRGLDLKGLCKELSLTLEPEDSEEEHDYENEDEDFKFSSMSTVGSKRGREIEDQNEDRVTKKSKYDQCNINVLPEELLMQILVRVPKKNIDTLSEVSSQWLQITRSRNFWKTSCQLKWTAMVASDNLDFNRQEYLVPTVTFNGKTLVDWQFYYKLRTKFGKATGAVAKYVAGQEGVDEKISKAVAEIISMGSELQHSTISRFLETMPVLSIQLDRPEFVIFIGPIVDVICDIALLRFNRDEFDWFKPTILLLAHLVESKKPQAKLFSLCKRTFDLCQLVRDKQPTTSILPLVLTVIRLLKAMATFDERSKKLFTLFTEYLIQLGPLDLENYDETRHDLVFRYPFSCQDPHGRMVLRNFRKVKEATIAIEVASRLYHTSEDWKVRASAVAVGLKRSDLTPEYIEKYCTMAVHAGKQTEQLLAFSGIVGLYKLLKKCNETVMKYFKKEQAVEVFELFTDALTRYDSTLGLRFYETLLRMLLTIQSAWISDELLDRAITNILNTLTQLNAPLEQPQDYCVYIFSRFGNVFTNRLSSKLDSIKAVLFNLANNNRFKTTRIVECYVNLGANVLGDEFAPEFRQITQQIIDGTFPLKVTVNKCYARFADVWLRYAESELERENIIKALLNAIPDEVSQFGQSSIIPKEIPLTAPNPLPSTLTALLEDYKCIEVSEFKLPVRHLPPKHHVPKEYLTPVNPIRLTRLDKGQEIKKEIARSYQVASQLLELVVSDDGKYIKHAQTVLNAMLAAFRIVGNHMILHHPILALLALVKPEMENKEFVKYIEIVFDTMDAEDDGGPIAADEKQMSDLFAFCFTLLEGLGVAKASTIANAINVYLSLYDSSPQRLLEIDDFICYCITMWPNTAYGGILRSNLAPWLVRRVKKAKSLEEMAPLLKVFATAAVFYGISFVWELCVDDLGEIDYESPGQYLKRIMPHCRALYEAGTKGTIAMDALELKYLRNFLILYAIYLVNDHSAEISMLYKLVPYDIDILSNVIASEKSFDTEVPELNEWFSRLDLKGLCKELSLTFEYEDEEAEEKDDDEDEV